MCSDHKRLENLKIIEKSIILTQRQYLFAFLYKIPDLSKS